MRPLLLLWVAAGCVGKGHAMRIFAYLGFLIIWLLAPAPMAVGDTAIQAATPDATESPSQPTPEEDLLNLLD